MRYSDFVDVIREYLQRKVSNRLGGGFTVSIQRITKNNGKILDSVVIRRDDTDVSPTIYLKEFYNSYMRGVELERITEQIFEIYCNSKLDMDINVEDFKSYKKIKNRIVFKLINTDENRKLLEKVPHKEFFDLSMVFYCIMDKEMKSEATALIHNAHMVLWGVNSEDIFNEAWKNTPINLPERILPLDMVLKDILASTLLFEDNEKAYNKKQICDYDENTMSEKMDEYNAKADDIMGNMRDYTKQMGVCVISNKNRLFGAGCMLYENVMKKFSERNDCKNIYIIPSSIHELILLPEYDGVDTMFIRETIREINRFEIDECDVLSDNLYMYSYDKNMIEIVE